MTSTRGIVFFDRDGTLIEEAGYLRDPSGMVLIPGAPEALRALSEAGYLLAVVSNQSGIARGLIKESELEAVRDAFIRHFLERGVTFAAVEHCPHHPEGTVERYRCVCDCRKPGTGMADRILAGLAVPASWSRYVVGDKMADVELGKRIGARTVLVATGYGPSERKEGERLGIVPDAYLTDVCAASRWILTGGTE